MSLGVCNGCQLLALLGWVGEGQDGAGMRKKKAIILIIVRTILELCTEAMQNYVTK